MNIENLLIRYAEANSNMPTRHPPITPEQAADIEHPSMFNHPNGYICHVLHYFTDEETLMFVYKWWNKPKQGWRYGIETDATGFWEHYTND